MKDKFLRMAGVETEEEFYDMFPTEEAFFEAYPAAREMKKGGSVPTDKKLYARVKALAKKKFDRWPSAYGSAWLVREYKKRGGRYRQAQLGGMMGNMMGGINPENPFAGAAMNVMQKNQQQQQGSGDLLGAAMKFAPMLIGMPPMADGGKMPQWLAEKRFKAAGNADKLDDYGYMYGGDVEMGYGRNMDYMYGGDYMQDGGEPDGEMAMGQLMSIMDKAEKLRQFIGEDTDLEPWVSSKLTMADDYIDGVSDYMMYSEDEGRDLEVEEDGGEYSMGELEEMKKGGIPSRYKKMGFTKVGQKKKSTRKGKKWMVLAKKGNKYKVVHGGYTGMKDFSQHGDKKRKGRFWDRMGGKDSARANDPFSPLYWHKKFKTWQEGGSIPDMEAMSEMYNPYEMMKNGGIYIDPAKRGTFKAQATKMGMGVQEAADTILNAPEGRYTPAMRRKANFARNFAKQMGGQIMMGDTMELDESEIQNLMDMGYGVEYID